MGFWPAEGQKVRVDVCIMSLLALTACSGDRDCQSLDAFLEGRVGSEAYVFDDLKRLSNSMSSGTLMLLKDALSRSNRIEQSSSTGIFSYGYVALGSANGEAITLHCIGEDQFQFRKCYFRCRSRNAATEFIRTNVTFKD
jgi:hypothetical protein